MSYNMSNKSEELLSKMSKHIPQEVVAKNALAAAPAAKDDSMVDVDTDYTYSRDTYKKLVDKGQDAIDHMMELAIQSDHPRAYEVLGGMLKNVSDMTDKLMSLHKNVDAVKTKKVDSKPSESGPVGQITNNNVFVGSTTDLQRYIISQQKAQVIDNEPNDNKE